MISGTWKGILVGACTVIAIAAVVGVVAAGIDDGAHDRRRVVEVFFTVCFFGMLPGVIFGAALGRLGEHLVARRELVLVCLTAVALVLCAALAGAWALIVIGALPTLAAGWVIERWTRPRAAESPVLTHVWRGAFLGVGCAGVIAIGVAVAVEPGHLCGAHNGDVPRGLIALGVACVALVPALGLGAACGWLAGVLAGRARLLRVAVLAAIATVPIVAAAAATHHLELVGVALAPCLIAVVVLERWTRRVATIPRALAVRDRRAF